MELTPYIEEVGHQLAIAADAGGEEARALAERLASTLDPVVRLTLLEALGVAAAEITRELAPGSVELRLRGREPEFVVTPAPVDTAREAAEDTPVASEEGAMARINLRLPDPLKRRIELAAERDGVSINAWLVRAVATAAERAESGPGPEGRVARGGQHYRGWVR